jgi:hypothetical protein
MGDQESISLHRLLVIALTLSLCIGLGFADAGVAQPRGQMIIAVDFQSAPTFFEPAEPPAMRTRCVFLYALHDALIRRHTADLFPGAVRRHANEGVSIYIP